jgi:RNA polymerase sigma-70 factor (ECF subfamily)
LSQICRPRHGRARYSPFLPSPPSSTVELALLDRLRGGDEQAFDELIRAEGPAMLRVARLYVGSQEVAEDVVQETWLRVLRSLDTFEQRSSLRTWIYVILANVARTRGEREGRSTPLASLQPTDERSVPEERFFPSSHPRWAGMWSTLVDSWESIPDERLLAGEVRAKLSSALLRLPARYAAVFTLRDVEGWTSDEVCAVLGLTAENQRVLLHRARSRIRALLEDYLAGAAG